MKRKLLRRIAATALIACMMFALLVPASAANTAVADAKNGVVEMIMGYTLENGDFLELSYGSGFLINDHAVMTCHHCVSADEKIRAAVEELTGKGFDIDRVGYRVVVSGDVTRTATIWPDAYSQNDDWAVLKLNDTISDRTPLPLGDSSVMEAASVYALGFPDSSVTDIPKYTSGDVTLTDGIVSSLGRVDGVPALQHSAQISAGSSGGPLVDDNGNVVGVNYGGYTGDGANYSYYAVQINEIKTVLTALGISYTDAGSESNPEGPTSEGPTSEEPTPEEPAPEGPTLEGPVTEILTPTPNPEPAVDTAKIDGLITQAEVYAAETDKYTPESLEALSAALRTANAAKNATDQATIDNAAADLQNAINGLQEAESLSNLPLILIIVGAIILIAVIVVIIIVATKSKKKKSAVAPQRPVAVGGSASGRPAVNPAPNGAPVPPFSSSSAGGYTPPVSEDSIGATTVLGGDGGAGETTVLVGSGASLTRSKNGETTRINRNEFIIGKERAKVDYCIGENSSISRRHAKLMMRGGRYYIVDLGSTNCTYVNGAKTPANMEIEIHDGDKIKFSDEEFTFHC